MSDIVEISLKTKIGRVAPKLKILIGDIVIFDGLMEQDKILRQAVDLSERLLIKIEKTGKTKAVVDSREPQEVIVEKIRLNGLDVHADKFGSFAQKDNSYVKDDILRGNHMMLNGTWELNLPIFRQNFFPDLEKPYRDSFEDAKIACFGCSFTFGQNLEYHQTWPYFLSKDARNYGMYGSSISSIVGTARNYLENNTCEKMIILLPHPCRLQLKDTDGSILTLLPGSSLEVEEKYKDIARNIVMFGEGSLLLSGYSNSLNAILEEIAGKTSLYLSSYTQETYDCLPHLNKGIFTILPFYEMSKEYEMAPNSKHPGPDHNRIFADKIKNIVLG